jgi:hypothetical protein
MNMQADFLTVFGSCHPLSGQEVQKRTFNSLMQESYAAYICFCDQDDVWLPNKISRSKDAMDELERRWGPETPLLVFTDLRLVGDRLQMLNESFWVHEKINPHSIDYLSRILSENIVTGCTAMLNRPLLALARRMPKEVFMHDHWVALLASAVGKATVIKTQTVFIASTKIMYLAQEKGAGKSEIWSTAFSRTVVVKLSGT